MNFPYKILIGIAGRKGSGKDLTASMICNILQVGIAAAKYKDFLLKEKFINLEAITHFADPLKKTLADLLNINIKYFYNRTHKDKLLFRISEWFDFKVKEHEMFISVEDANKKELFIIEHSHLTEHALTYYLNRHKNCCISLRLLLQYFATDVIRNRVYKDLWIFNTQNTINKTINKMGYCVIPDIRFENEADFIKKNNGFILKVIRENNDKIDHHESENINNIHADYTILNDKDKMKLFYIVITILQNIVKTVKERYDKEEKYKFK